MEHTQRTSIQGLRRLSLARYNLRGLTTSSHHIDERESTGTSVRAMLSRALGHDCHGADALQFCPLATAQVPTAPGGNRLRRKATEMDVHP